MIIKPLSTSAHQDFIGGHHLVPVYYTPQWQSLLKAMFQDSSQVWGIFNGKELHSIIPVTRQHMGKGMIRGVVSQPWGSWGGLFPEGSRDSCNALWNHLHNLPGTDLFILYKNPFDSGAYSGISKMPDSETLILDLNRKSDEIWGSLTSRKRNDIRRAEKKGVRVRLYTEDDAGKVAGEMYLQWLDNRQQNPGVRYDASFFQKCFTHLGKNIELYTAYHENNLIAGSIFYLGKKMIHYAFAFGDKNFYHLNAHSLILWEVCRLHAEKMSFLDLGSSREIRSLVKFKLAFQPQIYSISREVLPLSIKGRLYHGLKNKMEK